MYEAVYKYLTESKIKLTDRDMATTDSTETGDGSKVTSSDEYNCSCMDELSEEEIRDIMKMSLDAMTAVPPEQG